MQIGKLAKLMVGCGIGILGVTTSSFAASDASWSYHGKNGPAHWAKLSPDYAACGVVGKQSPIRIQPLLTQQEKPLNINYKPVDFRIEQAADDTYFFSEKPAADTITLDSDTYQLQEIHFHVPAEHQIGDQSYPMEVHLIHADAKGNNLAIGVLMEIGAESPFLTQEFKAMTSHKTYLKLNPETLLPVKSGFYVYDGSLTTPSCSPVKWAVMKKPMTASKEQLHEFKQKITSMNARPLQVRGNREIIEVVK